MRKILFAIVSLGALFGFAGTASAQTETTTFTVNAQVPEICLVSATPMDFGTYTPNGGARTTTSTISVRCTNTTTYTVALNAGTTAGASLAQRLLTDGTDTLEYNLYTTGALATVWGDGSGGTGTGSGTGAGMSVGAAINHTVHGELPDNANNQDASDGTYSDTITVTVTY